MTMMIDDRSSVSFVVERTRKSSQLSAGGPMHAESSIA